MRNFDNEACTIPYPCLALAYGFNAMLYASTGVSKPVNSQLLFKSIEQGCQGPERWASFSCQWCIWLPLYWYPYILRKTLPLIHILLLSSHLSLCSNLTLLMNKLRGRSLCILVKTGASEGDYSRTWIFKVIFRIILHIEPYMIAEDCRLDWKRMLKALHHT